MCRKACWSATATGARIQTEGSFLAKSNGREGERESESHRAAYMFADGTHCTARSYNQSVQRYTYRPRRSRKAHRAHTSMRMCARRWWSPVGTRKRGVLAWMTRHCRGARVPPTQPRSRSLYQHFCRNLNRALICQKILVRISVPAFDDDDG